MYGILYILKLLFFLRLLPVTQTLHQTIFLLFFLLKRRNTKKKEKKREGLLVVCGVCCFKFGNFGATSGRGIDLLFH